jgi:hypothetical protein
LLQNKQTREEEGKPESWKPLPSSSCWCWCCCCCCWYEEIQLPSDINCLAIFSMFRFMKLSASCFTMNKGHVKKV